MLYSGINYYMLIWAVLPAVILISDSTNDFLNFPSVSTSPLKTSPLKTKQDQQPAAGCSLSSSSGNI